MDNAEDESDFFNSLKSIENRLRAEILVLQLPIGSGKNLRGVIDLVSEKAYYLGFGDKDEKYVEGPVPEEMIETIRVYREKLISKILENNENLFEKYFVKGSISIEEIKLAIRGMTLKSRFSPVLCGSAYRNIGVRFLLDAVVDYLPSPLDRSQFEAYELNKFNDDDSDSGYESESEDSDSSKRVVLDSKKYDKLLALVYKIVIDEYNNRLAFLRIYSGAIEPNSYVVNPTKGRQRISRLFLVQANKRKPLERAIAGDIVGVIGLDEDTTTGDTICSLESSDLILEKISFSEPVISQAIRPVTQKDRSKLPAALKKLRSQDPSFYYSINETNQMIIGGMGELHLSIMLQRLSDEEGVQVHTNSPEVAYKETISGDSSTKHFISYTHKKQSGGAGQFARVDLEFSPNENSEKFLFIDAVVGEQLPKEFRPSVKKGIEEVLSQGGKILGYPIVGVKVRLVGGAWHSVDSSNDAFKTAATDAFREIMKRDDFVMCLKEPIMKVVVENYERYEGVIISSLSSKRGKPITQEEEKGLYFEVPLSELFNYTTTLRSLTKGEASFTMTPSHYQEVPGSVVEKLKKTVN